MKITRIYWLGNGHETIEDPHDIWEFEGSTWPKDFRRLARRMLADGLKPSYEYFTA